MAESAEEIYARVVAQVGENGRLPMPPVETWDIFPWEDVDGTWAPKVVGPPLEREEPRWGESDDKPCWCRHGEPQNSIWRNERWIVTTRNKPTGMPLIVILNTRQHMDFTDLDDDQAGEFGRITNWLHRAIAALPNIGRVHVCRWGDGGSHLHVWFIARPARLPHILGSMAVEWDEMLPPGPEDVWRADLKTVADQLAAHEGVALI